MTRSHPLSPRRCLTVMAAASVAAAACSEARGVDRLTSAPPPALVARLVLSDSAPAPGSELRIYVDVGSIPGTSIGSYTGRIAYDAAGLAYVGEADLGGGALRAVNALPGLLRTAGASPAGFSAGRLAGYRFRVVDPHAVQSLRLTIDELHTIARSDASPGLSIDPHPTVQRP